MSVEKTANEAQARRRWKHATVMMAWEKTCTNPETRTDPPCGTYDRLRAPKPDVDGHPPPFRSEWQRMRYESGLPQSEASVESAAWAQLLAHPPGAPLVHVDHGHRLEGAATAASCQNAWRPCEWYWKDQMKTDEGRARAQDRYKELASVANKGVQLDPGDDKERLVLMELLKVGGTMPKSPSWSPRVKAYPAKGTRASVLDALEARVEGLYEEHEEADTQRKYQETKDTQLGCHAGGYYQVKRVKVGKAYDKTAYTLYVSEKRVRRYFTSEDAAFNVKVVAVDEMYLNPGESKGYRITLPTHDGDTVTLEVCATGGKLLPTGLKVEKLDSEFYPAGKETDQARKRREPQLIATYYACAARAVWSRVPTSERVAGFTDVTWQQKK